MAFCKFSSSYQNKNQTLVDNVFITDFLPKAPDLCVKAYLLGLQKCNSADDYENSLEYFSKTLNVCEDDIVALFRYWEDMGLVQVLSTNPIEVRYLAINASTVGVKKFKVDKYTNFNVQAQELIGERMIMPNDYADFYNLMEKQHITQEAMLAIIKYCVDFKGFNINPKYIIAVAKDWAREGITTMDQVNEKITELGVVDDKMSLVLAGLGTKRKIQLEDKELLNKWLNSFGFDLNVILFVVKLLKNKKRNCDINVLDDSLTKYFEMKLMSVQEIENYENEKEHLFAIAVAVNKELGLYYEDLTKEIETYIVPWINMGYDEEMLKMVADNCFKSSIRTLDGVNNIITKLFKLGIVNISSYLEYINDNLALDEKIKQVLLELHLTRNVNNMDRNFYSIWTNDWGFAHEVILYASTLAANSNNAMQYLNKILSNWNSQGIKSLDKAKITKVDNAETNKFIHNEYSKDQIKSLISNLDEVEV